MKHAYLGYISNKQPDQRCCRPFLMAIITEMCGRLQTLIFLFCKSRELGGVVCNIEKLMNIEFHSQNLILVNNTNLYTLSLIFSICF